MCKAILKDLAPTVFVHHIQNIESNHEQSMGDRFLETFIAANVTGYWSVAYLSSYHEKAIQRCIELT